MLIKKPKKQKGLGPNLTFDRNLSVHTVTHYDSSWRRWTGFCEAKGYLNFPANPENVAEFILSLAPDFKSGSIRTIMEGIGVVHTERDIPSPIKRLVVTRTFANICDEKGDDTRQANPINAELRDAMIAACDITTIEGLRDRAMISLAYDTMVRAGELAAINLAEITPSPIGPGASAKFRRTKTGIGRTAYVTPRTADYVIAYAKKAKIVTGRLFRSTNHGRVGESLTRHAVARAFKKRARLAGAAPEIVAHISGHSTRVGAAQDMAARGESDAAIMQAGGWKNVPAMKKYIDNIQACRAGMARLAEAQGMDSAPKPKISISAAVQLDATVMSKIIAALAPFVEIGAFNVAAS